MALLVQLQLDVLLLLLVGLLLQQQLLLLLLLLGQGLSLQVILAQLSPAPQLLLLALMFPLPLRLHLRHRLVLRCVSLLLPLQLPLLPHLLQLHVPSGQLLPLQSLALLEGEHTLLLPIPLPLQVLPGGWARAWTTGVTVTREAVPGAELGGHRARGRWQGKGSAAVLPGSRLVLGQGGPTRTHNVRCGGWNGKGSVVLSATSGGSVGGGVQDCRGGDCGTWALVPWQGVPTAWDRYFGGGQVRCVGARLGHGWCPSGPVSRCAMVCVQRGHAWGRVQADRGLSTAVV